MKNLILFLVGFLLLSLLGLVSVPFWYDINQLRPKIEQALPSDKGRLQVGQLELKVLPQIKVVAQGTKYFPPSSVADQLQMMDAVFKADRVEFIVSLKSLFRRKLVGTLVVNEPAVKYVTLGDVNSFTGLMGAPTAGDAPASTSPDSASTATETPSSPAASPNALLAALDFGLDIRGATIQFQDLAQAGSAISLSPVSLVIPSIRADGEIEGRLGLGFENLAKAGVTVSGSSQAQFKVAGAFDSIGPKKFQATVDLSALVLEGAIQKPAGGEHQVVFEGRLEAENGPLVLSVRPGLLGMKAEINMTRTAAADLRVDGTFEAIDLGKLAAFVPALREMSPTGQLMIQDISFQGTSSGASTYGANLKFDDVKLSPKGAEVVSLAGDTKVTHESVNSNLVVGVEGQALNVRAELQHAAPQKVLSFTGQSAKFDARPFHAKPAPEGQSFNKGYGLIPAVFANQPQAVGQKPHNPLLSLASIDFVKNLRSSWKLSIGELKTRQGDFNKFEANMNCQSVNCEYQGGLRGFGGELQTRGNFVGNQSALPVTTNLTLKDLDISQLAKVGLQQLAANVTGKLGGQVQLSFPVYAGGVMLESTGSGKLEIVKGELKGLKAQEWLDSIFQAVPLLSGRKSPKLESNFKRLQTQWSLGKGILNVRELEFQGNGRQSVDAKFSGTVDLVKSTLNMSGDLIDRQGLLGIRELRDARGQTFIPVKLDGPYAKPKPDVAYTASRLAKSAIKNNSQAIKDKVVESVKDPAKIENLKDAGKDLLKRFRSR